MKSTCIFVTGPAHSGTRLFVDMFAQHPDVSVPTASLKAHGELRPWIPFFVQAADNTPLYSEDYAIDPDELRFILDVYMESVDQSKPWFLLKLPFYPLLCMDLFAEYFEHNMVLLYSQRPAEKIIRSYTNRSEDRKLFSENSLEQLRQVKKLPVAERKHHLAHPDAQVFFTALVAHTNALRKRWDDAHPDLQFIDVDVEEIAQSRAYVVDLLKTIGVPTEGADAMMSVVDQDRLLRHKTQEGNQRNVKALIRSVTPPLIWELAARLRNK